MCPGVNLFDIRPALVVGQLPEHKASWITFRLVATSYTHHLMSLGCYYLSLAGHRSGIFPIRTLPLYYLGDLARSGLEAHSPGHSTASSQRVANDPLLCVGDAYIYKYVYINSGFILEECLLT